METQTTAATSNVNRVCHSTTFLFTWGKNEWGHYPWFKLYNLLSRIASMQTWRQAWSLPHSYLIQGFEDSIKANVHTVCCPWLQSSTAGTKTAVTQVVAGIRIGSLERLYLFLFSLSLQQYVMLHDMVAAHSIVRVSVCRANNGLLSIYLSVCMSIYISISLLFSLFNFISN